MLFTGWSVRFCNVRSRVFWKIVHCARGFSSGEIKRRRSFLVLRGWSTTIPNVCHISTFTRIGVRVFDARRGNGKSWGWRRGACIPRRKKFHIVKIVLLRRHVVTGQERSRLLIIFQFRRRRGLKRRFLESILAVH